MWDETEVFFRRTLQIKKDQGSHKKFYENLGLFGRLLLTAKEKRIEKIRLFRLRSILEQESDGVNAGQSNDAKDDSANDG